MKFQFSGATIRPYYPPEEGIILIGLGTIINAGAIVVGGLLGLLLKNALPQRISDTLTKAIGICVLFIACPAHCRTCLRSKTARSPSAAR